MITLLTSYFSLILKEPKRLITGYTELVVLCTFSYLTWLLGLESLVITITLLSYLMIKFVVEIDLKVPFIHFMPILAVTQCLLLPSILYYLDQFDIDHLRYLMMPISANAYLGYALPAILLLVLTIHFPFAAPRSIKYYCSANAKSAIHSDASIYLFVVGIFSIILRNFAPPGLQFFLYLTSNFVCVATCYALVTGRWYGSVIAGVSVVILILSAFNVKIMGLELIVSSADGSFLDLIFWSAYFLIFLLARMHKKLWVKVGLLVGGLAVIILLQSIKPGYRKTVASKNSHGVTITKGEVVRNLMGKHLFQGEIFSQATARSLLNRLNQGSLVGYVMNHVPENEPYAGGETISTAILASLVPRIIWANKPVAGGEGKIERFTGFEERDGMSANIGLLGEGYANFGFLGGVFFVFSYGLFFSIVNAGILRLSKKLPSLILWMPLLYFAVVVVETDFVTVLNHLIKTSFLVATIYFLCYKVFKIRI